MTPIYPGHLYALDNLKDEGFQPLQFRQDSPHPEVAGTSCQEVLRVLIDRVQVLDKELPWSGNQDIVSHLRQALAGFEARAILRKAAKGLDVENIDLHKDGHFTLIRKD